MFDVVLAPAQLLQSDFIDTTIELMESIMALKYPNGYEYIDHIATRAFGGVFKVLSPGGAEVALKVANSEGNVHRRFKREIKAMIDAAGQNTMPVLDFDESYSWYTMPLASKTLGSIQVPVQKPEVALEVLQAIANSLRPLHANGQVHRDLKPENILFVSTEGVDRWVIADFGIVRNILGQTTASLTVQGSLTGTFNWAAPEQFLDAHDADPSTDVYSAGLIMGWLLTGKTPVPGVRYSSLGSLTSTILRATEQEKSNRFATMDDFLAHFTAHMLPAKAKLASLFSDAFYGEIHGYLLERADQLPSLAKQMLKLDEDQISAWLRDDLFGLVRTTELVSGGLDEYFNDIGRESVDRFLIWVLSVCTVLRRANYLDELVTLLSAQMRATELLDQCSPRRATV